MPPRSDGCKSIARTSRLLTGPIALYGDSRVRILANRQSDYIQVEVIRNDYSGTAAFARIDALVRSTLSRRYQNRLYVEPEADLSHPIITY